jgi:hypothetical protein
MKQVTEYHAIMQHMNVEEGVKNKGKVIHGLSQSNTRHRLRLGEGGVDVRFPVQARHFSILHKVQTGSGAHTASYTMGTRGCFPGL